MKMRRILCLIFTLTLLLTLSPTPNARAATILYSIGVDLTNQIVTVYDVDSGDIVRQMICSSGAKGTPTRTGTFSMPQKRDRSERSLWYHFSVGGFAHYATRVHEGYMFHSYLYNSKDESTLSHKTVAYLGVPVSHGCMRLRPDDAEWIAKNCPAGTKVKIYYSNERNEYLRSLMKVRSYNSETGESYNAFVGGATSEGELGYGSEGETVRKLQLRLQGLGLYTGDTDAVYGAEMVETISTLQTALGLNPDGKVTMGLWQLLFSDDAPTSSLSNASMGTSGPIVSYTQALLKKAAMYEGEISGTFDAETDTAVRRFQSYIGADTTGILTDSQYLALQDLVDELVMRFPGGYALETWNETQKMASIETRVRLNIRAEASTESASLGQLQPKDVVRVLESAGQWTKIRYQDITGYVKTEYIKKYDTTVPACDYVSQNNPELVAFNEKSYAFTPLLACRDVVVGTGTRANNMIFYLDKSTKADVAFGLLQGSTIEVADAGDDWAEATYCGVTGYIPTKELRFSTRRELDIIAEGEERLVTARNLNAEDVPVYANVSVNSDVLGALAPGEEAQVTRQGDTWSEIAFNGGVGYVENRLLQIGVLSQELREYVASVSRYFTAEGGIEGATVASGDREFAAEINREEAIPEVDLTAEAADDLDDYVPWEDADGDFADELPDESFAGMDGAAPQQDYSGYAYDGEDIDTSAARAAFDAADAEDGQ